MNQREKEIAAVVVAAIPKMDDFTKGYFLGQAEALVTQNEPNRDKTQKSAAEERR